MLKYNNKNILTAIALSQGSSDDFTCIRYEIGLLLMLIYWMEAYIL
jgi:hypothetical protein